MTFLILITAHFLGDFTFQPNMLANKKKKNFSALIIHSLIYSLIFLLVLGLFTKFEFTWIPLIIISLSHFIIDFIKTKLEIKYVNKIFVFWSFLIDQIFHLSIILFCTLQFSILESKSCLFVYLSGLQYFNKIVLYTLLSILLMSPSSVFIRKLFSLISHSKNTNETNESNLEIINAGNIIGKLERIIVSVLVLFDQFGVIGLVLTAKSIARFKQMDDQNFAEKYLVGTLTSISISIILTLIIKSLINFA